MSQVAGTEKSENDLFRLERIRLRATLGGSIFRRDIPAVYEISLATVDIWRENGLRLFRPATGGQMVLVADLQAFMQTRPDLKGRGPKKKPKGRKK